MEEEKDKTSSEVVSFEEMMKRIDAGNVDPVNLLIAKKTADFGTFCNVSARLFGINVLVTISVGLNMFLHSTEDMMFATRSRDLVETSINGAIKALELHKEHLLKVLDENPAENIEEKLKKEFEESKKADNN